MKPMQFERNGHTIKGMATHKRIVYKSINEAKRVSRVKQMELDGALGRGSVRRAN